MLHINISSIISVQTALEQTIIPSRPVFYGPEFLTQVQILDSELVTLLITMPITEPVIQSSGSDEFLLDSPIDEFQHVQLTGSGLLLVHNNNIYFANDVTRLDEPCYQITASGSDELLNGLTLATYRGFYKNA